MVIKVYLEEELGCLQVVVGLAIQLHSIDDLVLLKQMFSILGQQGINLSYIVSFGQINGCVPLVQLHATINGGFDTLALLN